MSKETSTSTKNTSTSVLPNSAQSLTDSQQSLMENLQYPENWNEKNPDLIASPFPWSGTYTNPAWYGSNNQQGNGFMENISNQFTSAMTQPLGMHVNWLGRETTVGQRLVNQNGGARDLPDYMYDGWSMPYVLQNIKKNPSRAMNGSGKKKKYQKRK